MRFPVRLHPSLQAAAGAVILLFPCLPAPAPAQALYHPYERFTARLNELVKAHPDRASIGSIGRTTGGRDIWVVTIGSGEKGAKPAVLVLGGTGGTRIVESELALRFVGDLLEDRSDSVKGLLERTTFYVVPRASPDAVESRFAPVRHESDANGTPFDDDRDGAADEDGYDDLNGDGMITLMRVRSASGGYIPDPGDPRVMRPADGARGERGIYEIYSEGRDDDGDERYNEDPKGGVDFNMNFPYNYPYFKAGAGAHQVSEVETRAVADFCYDHPNIAVVFAFSPQNNLLNPWTPKPGEERRKISTVREEDSPYMKRIADLYGEITGFEGAPEYAAGEGSFVEWGYYHFGRWSFGANGWWTPKAPERPDTSKADTSKGSPSKEKGGKGEKPKRDAGVDALAWLEANGVQGAFVPWTRVEHPDFPGKEVEIGGFAPFVRDNPPAGSLDSLGAAQSRFLRTLGSLLPRIEGVELKSEKIAPGVTRVSLDVVNTGFLPTLSGMGARSRVPLDVKAEVILDKGQTLAAGRRVQLLGPIDGSGGVTKLSWLIQGTGAVTVNVAGPMTGGFEKKIELR